MIQVEAHFDESIGEKGRKITCVAGLIFESRQARKMSRDWSVALREFDISHFHMADCAHGNGIFKGMNVGKRDRIARRMMGVLKKRAMQALAVTVYDDEFARIIPKHNFIGSPYSMLCRVIIGGVAAWFEHRKVAGNASYFFEAGQKHQSVANDIMNRVYSQQEWRELAHYRRHAFVPKIGSPGVQCADILAWQWYTDRRHQSEGRPRRKDLASLLEAVHHNAMHLDEGKLNKMMYGLTETARKKNISVQDVAFL